MVLKAEVADQDYSKANMNFYTDTGQLRGLPGRKIAGNYDLEYHLSRTSNKDVQKQILKLVGQYSKEEGVTISYSQRRICFKKGLTFLSAEIGKNGVKIRK